MRHLELLLRGKNNRLDVLAVKKKPNHVNSTELQIYGIPMVRPIVLLRQLSPYERCRFDREN